MWAAKRSPATSTSLKALKATGSPAGPFGIVQLRRHYERLCRSARLLHIPFDSTFEHYRDAIAELAVSLLDPNRDMWFRTTLYAIQGQWGEGTVADLVITAYHQDQKIPGPNQPWHQHVAAEAQTCLFPHVSRLAATIKSRASLASKADPAAARTWSCLTIRAASPKRPARHRHGARRRHLSPPATEGALESITLDIVEALAHSMKIPFIRRPIDRTELLVADEIAICGTLAELVLVDLWTDFRSTRSPICSTPSRTRFFWGGAQHRATPRQLNSPSSRAARPLRASVV